jgi:hypothetical protein
VNSLNYSPLPESIRQQALALLGQITDGGKPVTPSATVTG